MLEKTFLLALAVFCSPLPRVSASDLALPASPSSVEVPVVPPPSVDTALLKAQYEEYYSALNSYSNAAYAAPQDSPVFLEAEASGQYLRSKLEALSARAAGAGLVFTGPAGGTRGPAEVSWAVRNELNDAFGFYGAPEAGRGQTRGVPIKQGYCQINYVKNNVPFLVQYDGFLKKGEVIITFDDGPGPLTKEVSGSMKEGGAQVLFFVLGRNFTGAAGKDRIKTEVDDGHFTGVHGYNHATEGDKPFTSYTAEKTISQLGQVSEMIAGVTGRKPVFFRPPYGIITPEALNAVSSGLGLTPVGWTIDTLDWSTKDPEELFQNTVSMLRRRGKGIVLMHDIHPQSRTASKRLLGWLAENGFKVVSPDRLTRAFKGE